jgi:hypothetical protein
MGNERAPISRLAPTRLARFLARSIDVFDAGFLRTWRERVLARQTCRESLRIYRELQATRSELTGVARYQEVVARQTGLDEKGAKKLVELAEDSFASWPVERPLTFRDVVQYLVADQILTADPTVPGTRSRLTAIVVDEIPQEL